MPNEIHRLVPKVILAMSLTASTLPATAQGDSPIYSIQVAAIPLAQPNSGLALYERLLAQGYLVYHFRYQSEAQDWMRIRVGAFASESEAKDYARQLRRSQALDSYVARSPLRVQENKGVRLVTTPNAVWVEDGTTARELFRLSAYADAKGRFGIDEVTADLAPDASAVAIAYGSRLVTLPVAGGEPQVVADFSELGSLYQPVGKWRHFVKPMAKWSPDGAWIALVPEREFEVKSDLWVFPSAGGKPRHLVDNSNTRDSVKSFVWHPSLPLIFYVAGYAYGTVSPGGSIYAVDLEEKRALVREPAHRLQQLGGELAVRDGHLHYQIIQFTENHLSSAYKAARMPLPSWPLTP